MVRNPLPVLLAALLHLPSAVVVGPPELPQPGRGAPAVPQSNQWPWVPAERQRPDRVPPVAAGQEAGFPWRKSTAEPLKLQPMPRVTGRFGLLFLDPFAVKDVLWVKTHIPIGFLLPFRSGLRRMQLMRLRLVSQGKVDRSR